MKKIIIVLALMLVIMSFVSASQLGVYKQNSCVNLKQTCSNCTFVNITSIIQPDSVKVISNSPMTKLGTEYNYTFCGTSKQGTYTYTTLGDLDGVNSVEAITFDVTPSGNSNVLGFSILVILIVYSIAFLGFFGKHEWITILGGMGMIALGIFTINNGIDIYRNFITDVFSWASIALGVIFAFEAGLSLIDINL